MAGKKMVVSVFDYDAESDNELTIREGDVITVLTEDGSGWWLGQLASGKRGVFPSNFTEPYTGGSPPAASQQQQQPPQQPQGHEQGSPPQTTDSQGGGGEGGGDGATAAEERPKAFGMVPTFGGAGVSSELFSKLRSRQQSSAGGGGPSMRTPGEPPIAQQGQGQGYVPPQQLASGKGASVIVRGSKGGNLSPKGAPDTQGPLPAVGPFGRTPSDRSGGISGSGGGGGSGGGNVATGAPPPAAASSGLRTRAPPPGGSGGGGGGGGGPVPGGGAEAGARGSPPAELKFGSKGHSVIMRRPSNPPQPSIDLQRAAEFSGGAVPRAMSNEAPASTGLRTRDNTKRPIETSSGSGSGTGSGTGSGISGSGGGGGGGGGERNPMMTSAAPAAAGGGPPVPRRPGGGGGAPAESAAPSTAPAVMQPTREAPSAPSKRAGGAGAPAGGSSPEPQRKGSPLEKSAPAKQPIKVTPIETVPEQPRSSPTQETSTRPAPSRAEPETTQVTEPKKWPSSLPDFTTFCSELVSIAEQLRKQGLGQVPTEPSWISRADPSSFGFALCTVDGVRFGYGDHNRRFVLAECARPFTYGFCCQEMGIKQVTQQFANVARTSADEYELTAQGKVHNAFTQAGALKICSMIYPTFEPPMKISQYLRCLTEMSPPKQPFEMSTLPISMPAYLSIQDSSLSGTGLAHWLVARRVLAESVKLGDVVDLLIQMSAVEVGCGELSVLAATLANMGTCPITNKRCIKNEVAQEVLQHMAAFGTMANKRTGAIAAKSSFSGAVFVSVPGVFGLAVYSPRLNESTNESAAGIRFLEAICSRYPQLSSS